MKNIIRITLNIAYTHTPGEPCGDSHFVIHMDAELVNSCKHDDIHRGFVLAFHEKPDIDLVDLESKVKEAIAANLPVHYVDESHIAVGDHIHQCSGPRTHVSTTSKIEGFCLNPEIVHDKQLDRYLLIGFVGENSAENLARLQEQTRPKFNMFSDIIF